MSDDLTFTRALQPGEEPDFEPWLYIRVEARGESAEIISKAVDEILSMREEASLSAAATDDGIAS